MTIRRRSTLARAVPLLGCIAAISFWVAPAGRAATPPVDIVVSPAGQGAACNQAQPCPLATGQQTVRRWAGTTPVTVTLLDGTYQMSEPLHFGAQDSGTPSDPVVYQAAPGAHPVLSGGMTVSGWSPVPGTPGLWSASVPAGTQSRQLYVNGQRAPRTTGSLPGVWHQTADGYTTTDSSVASWRNPGSLELVFTQGNGFWTEPRCDVASVTPATGGGTNVTVRQPCWSNLHIPDGPASVGVPSEDHDDNAMGGFEGISAATNPSAIENAYELLSTPGQWYLDNQRSTVFYLAHPGEDPNQDRVVMPVAQTLVEADGTPDSPVHDIQLRGLTFAYTTWLQPSSDDGFAEMQANVTLTGENASGSDTTSTKPPEGTCHYSDPQTGTCPFAAWTKEPAAVTFHGAHDVVVTGDTFTHLGAAGLNFDLGSQDNLIQGNEVTDTSGNGIQLGGTNDPQPLNGDPNEINDGNRIADNWVHDIAAEFHGGVGIWVGYTRHTSVDHNEIDRTPYTAISIGWGGWHTDTLHADNPSIVGDNSITDNLIYDYLTTLADGGAIYTNGVQGPADPSGPAADPFLTATASDSQMAAGLTITGNVALVATWSEFAYYNDEGADYVTWYNNVEYQNHALATGGCNTVGHIRIDSNFWAQPVEGYGGYICPPPPVDVVVTNHHVIPDHPGPGDIPVPILQNAGLQDGFRYLVTDHPPIVTGVGPDGPDSEAGPATSEMLVSGSGFTPDSTVYFGTPGPSTRSPSVTVLSANYLTAAPPPGASGQVDIFVTTPSGTSPASSADQYTVLPG